MFGRKCYPLPPAICLAWSRVAGVALFTHNVCVTLVGLCPELYDSKISTRLAGNFPFPHPQMLEDRDLSSLLCLVTSRAFKD